MMNIKLKYINKYFSIRKSILFDKGKIKKFNPK